MRQTSKDLEENCKAWFGLEAIHLKAVLLVPEAVDAVKAVEAVLNIS